MNITTLNFRKATVLLMIPNVLLGVECCTELISRPITTCCDPNTTIQHPGQGYVWINTARMVAGIAENYVNFISREMTCKFETLLVNIWIIMTLL